MVSGSSETETAMVESPTGPPANLRQIVSKIFRSISSRPCGSISKSERELVATSPVMKLSWFTCA